MTRKVLLQAKDIKKSFTHPKPFQVLRGVSLDVKAGESIAIMGASGEGKSTLLSVLGSLDHPCEGRLEIAGQVLGPRNRAAIRNHHIGFVFQSFCLLEDYSALENVLLPAKIARKNVRPGSLAYKRGLQLLEKVGLPERAQFPAKVLSGGEKQRVAIARAMCNNPDIILADEPSGNLDHETSEAIHNLLFSFVRDSDKALIVVTHDQKLANLCDKTYQLQGGVFLPQAGEQG